MVNFHEELFALNFVKPEKRERYLSLLQSSKGRTKLIFGFNHCSDIDFRFAKRVSVEQQSPEIIQRILQQKGAPEICHIMSSNPNIDGESLPLNEALEKTVGWGMGTLISCVPGKLAYFEFEDPKERYILEGVALPFTKWFTLSPTNLSEITAAL
jgi:hypothetical protein